MNKFIKQNNKDKKVKINKIQWKETVIILLLFKCYYDWKENQALKKELNDLKAKQLDIQKLLTDLEKNNLLSNEKISINIIHYQQITSSIVDVSGNVEIGGNFAPLLTNDLAREELNGYFVFSSVLNLIEKVGEGFSWLKTRISGWWE